MIAECSSYVNTMQGWVALWKTMQYSLVILQLELVLHAR